MVLSVTSISDVESRSNCRSSMKLNNSHMWMYNTIHKIQMNPKLSWGDFMIEHKYVEYLKVLMEDGLIVFDDGKYITTEHGQTVMDTIEVYREL